MTKKFTVYPKTISASKRVMPSDWLKCRHTLSLRNGTDIENYCYENRDLADGYIGTVNPKYVNEDYDNPQWELSVYSPRSFNPVEIKVFDNPDSAMSYAETQYGTH